ncbi:hypothetical protein ACH4SP_24875 [Streptomyces sp. NPDC021093]|uniref:hypothetical protein n=1 Tax=Streptomyces sp. NPDC021093 TaxID=3365112 RepID=UPI0037B8DFC9
MLWKIEVDGYAAGLDAELAWVFRNPRGGKLKQLPRKVEGHPELARMRRLKQIARAHGRECAERAEEWAASDVVVPEELAAADPVWREALEAAGVRVRDGAGGRVRDGAGVQVRDGVSGEADEGLIARAYVHAVSGRRLVQVMGEETAPYRDVVMRHDGWERAEGFATGLSGRVGDAELPFPERVLAAHPGMVEVVLEAADGLRECGAYKKSIDAFLKGLEKSAPVLLPVFLDAAAEACLDAEFGADPDAAGAYFGRSRKAERERGHPMDQEWVRARYLKYADAKALSATAVRARAKELGVKGACTPARAAEFRELVTRRAAAAGGGDGVYPQLAADVRKLAKGAGLDPEEELAAVLVDSGLVRDIWLNKDEFWTDVLKGKAFDLAVAREPEAVRAGALRLVPGPWTSWQGLWAELLDRSGLMARLTGKEPGLADGETARWLRRCLNSLNGRRNCPKQWMYDLAERLAPRLTADGVPVDICYDPSSRGWPQGLPLDLVDLLLEHGVPVTDPPELLGGFRLSSVHVERRPELRFVRADPRFARELRALLRAGLDMRGDVTYGGNTWYQPHEAKGWAELPPLYAHGTGHEVVREWCAAERELLARGPSLEQLALLLGRFAHAGAAVDTALKDAGAAEQFAAVDVVELVRAELPEGPEGAAADRSEVAELLAGTAVKSVYASERARLGSRGYVLQVGANCLAGLERTVAQLAPEGWRTAAAVRAEGGGAAGASASAGASNTSAEAGASEGAVSAGASNGAGNRTGAHEPSGGSHPRPLGSGSGEGQGGGEPALSGLGLVCHRLAELATDPSVAIWRGELTAPSAKFEAGHGLARQLKSLHAFTARQALSHESRGPNRSAVAPAVFADYAHLPFVGAAAEQAGRWRVVRTEWKGERAGFVGAAYRTETSAAVVLEASPNHRILLEHAPRGEFGEGGPLAAGGCGATSAQLLKPQRDASWYARFAELWAERGRVPARPELAVDFAGRTGLPVADAALLLVAHLDCDPYQLATANPVFTTIAWPEAWQLKRAEVDAAADGLAGLFDRADITALYERLLPDDPERLWTEGPDVERAVRWWRERFGEPMPVPIELLPLAGKESVRPKGEDALPRDRGRDRMWWPTFRFNAAAGRLVSGDEVLASGLPPLAGPPDLLGPVRVAAWLAYRTPVGDPVRPAVGAAIGRLRSELAAGPGPLTLFSVQSNYLMGAPESPEDAGLTTHPAVTVEDDATYDMRNVRVDPALLSGADDPVLDRLDDYLDSVLPSQWVPARNGLPGIADLRILLSPEFGELGEQLAGERGDQLAGEHAGGSARGSAKGSAAGWAQDPARSVPHLVSACAAAYGLSADAAAYFLMLAALPDPTDRMVKQWTGWSPARFKAVREELAASGRVVQVTRSRAGRGLFLAGLWQERKVPRLPLEAAKLRLLGPTAAERRSTSHMATVPHGTVATLFERCAAERGLV